MNLWEPYHSITYFLHTLLGTAGVLAAVIALAVLKGSLHMCAPVEYSRSLPAHNNLEADGRFMACSLRSLFI